MRPQWKLLSKVIKRASRLMSTLMVWEGCVPGFQEERERESPSPPLSLYNLVLCFSPTELILSFILYTETVILSIALPWVLWVFLEGASVVRTPKFVASHTGVPKDIGLSTVSEGGGQFCGTELTNLCDLC